MTRVRAIAAFLADRGDHERARADHLRRARREAAVQVCDCRDCRAFYRRRPLDGWQLLLFPRVEIEAPTPPAGSGSRPDAAPFPVPVPATAIAGALSRKPETVTP